MSLASISSARGRLLQWRPSLAALRRSCLAALVANTAIVLTGGAVRLTNSGLGCPSWPQCTAGSLVPTAKLGINGDIEFTNRMLTYAVSAAVGAAIIASMRARPRRAVLVKLSWALFAGVVAQAVIGGISVRTDLAPIWVALHLVVSMGLIAVSYVLWVRSGETDAAPTLVVRNELRMLGLVLTSVVAALIVAGTVVTGSGPHSGSKDAKHRFPFSPTTATQFHADLVFLVFGLTVALWFALRATGADAAIVRKVLDLFVVCLAQGVIGYVQYFTKLPIVLVGLHMFGACLVWIATLRVLLSMRSRPAASEA